ncbi:VOC family protein [Glaciibacter psychrotolerans]|uniref:Putative pterin-4-alpha-carbinolamine dehydratase n=1 Tax=Glaciibacter psychrotolerans TaxID=670054 RepID=A0A7Z0J6H4_9MICO|nr:VOC family protein [Leifsonia psychrotolerans]NYJ19954.1 4a-hydroxytetrahydrobiopterin dehydratase [Leifsonia psychrotolerans]
MTPEKTLTPADTADAVCGTAFVHFDGILHATFHTADFVSALALVTRVGQAAETMNHHPDVTLGWGSVGFALSSHDAAGVTERDLHLAGRIQEIADELGATPATALPARYDIAIDCTDAGALIPFWRVGLGYLESSGDDGIELVDPLGRSPRIWFQHMQIARTDRNRIHLDVYLPQADAPGRVHDIVAAGGLLLTDEHAPDWWVLADPEGNELCVCTTAA